MRAFGLAILMCASLAGPAPSQSSYEELQAFSGLLNQIRLNYIDSVNYRELVQGAIDGVLRSLDPHSYFLPREALERRSSYEAGKLAGTGITLDEIGGTPVVLSLEAGSPAARSGLMPGDRVVAINDTSVAGLGIETIQTRMIGDKGARLRVGVERGPRAAPVRFSASLKLDFIPARSVMLATMLDERTGYLRLARFFPETGQEVETGLKGLGPKMNRLVLDLRGNPGGSMTSAVDVASIFLTDGRPVLELRGRIAFDNRKYASRGEGAFRWMPLVVLVDQGSASAAETLAGALQDLDRAVIVGRRTFGKALAQRPIPLSPRGDVVFLTVARAVTPSGRVIQRPYVNLTPEQYLLQAGTPAVSNDTTVFRTTGGRVVRGGGGVVPDIMLPSVPDPPDWWAAASSDWFAALIDSVAQTLDQASFEKWKVSPGEWHARLALPFYARIRDKLQIEPHPDSAVNARIARMMAYRATEVRWGTDKAYQLGLANDEEIRAAVGAFAEYETTLRKP